MYSLRELATIAWHLCLLRDFILEIFYSGMNLHLQIPRIYFALQQFRSLPLSTAAAAEINISILLSRVYFRVRLRPLAIFALVTHNWALVLLLIIEWLEIYDAPHTGSFDFSIGAHRKIAILILVWLALIEFLVLLQSVVWIVDMFRILKAI
jgi:hypothetical protein